MSKEIEVSDEELDALMAELEEATGVSAAAAVPAPAASRVVMAEDEPAPAAAEPEPAVAVPDPVQAPEPQPEEEDEQAMLDALEAQLALAEQAERAKQAEPEPVPDPGPAPEPEPAPAPEPAPRRVVVNEDGTKTMPSFGAKTEPVASEEDDGLPAPAKKAPALDFYVDVDDFKRSISVTENNLDTCMIQQAGLRAFHGAQAARAEAQHARLKVRFEVLEARLYDEHRKLLMATGEKVTEKAVENAVRLDPRYLAGKTRVIEAESIANVNRAMVDSLRDRASMVIQLATDRRDEFKGQARLMAQQQDRDDLRSRALAAGQRAIAA